MIRQHHQGKKFTLGCRSHAFELLHPINYRLLTLDQSLTLKILVHITTAEARMLHIREVSEEKRHAELGNSAAGIFLELSRVSRIVFGGENLHGDGSLIDIPFREKRRVANGDTVDQWRLMLASCEAKSGPTAVTESDRADEGVCEIDFMLVVRCIDVSSQKGKK